MDVKLACGDNIVEDGDINKITDQTEEKDINADDTKLKEEQKNNEYYAEGKYQTETITEKDLNLKERIANCKKIIESLKLELTEEKAKLQEESKSSVVPATDHATFDVARCCSHLSYPNKFNSDTLAHSDTNYIYSSSIDSKITCDVSLMEYEKQLQRYQETLTMAQTEKKNAIRKQMIAKVYKLKLLEVENQCNIELLRVKQSLQCLEPLKAIASKWKINENNSTCDLNNYDLIPRYPELNPILTNDVNIFTDDEKSEFIVP